MNEEDLHVRCDCYDPEHMLILSKNKEDNEVDVLIHLVSYENVFKRILTAIRYVLGYRCRYGHWDSLILNKESCEKIAKFLST